MTEDLASSTIAPDLGQAYSHNMNRKHTAQMTDIEKAFAHGYLRGQADKLTGSTHFYDRASDRTFCLADAVEAAKKGKIVEVNDNPGFRVLVRDMKGTCCVISLKTLTVITVYYNDPADTHSTLNWNQYQWKQDIAELVKSIRSARSTKV